MADVVAGACIEGEKLFVQGRRVEPRTPIWVGQNPRKIRYQFKLSITGSAEVTEELNAELRLSPHSVLTVGAQIRGDTISGHAGKLGKVELYRATGGHKGSCMQASKQALAKIDIPLRQVAEAAALQGARALTKDA